MTAAPERGPRWLEYVPLDDLRPDPRNPKNHRLDTLRESVVRWGYSEPVQVDERTGLIVSGHGRRELLLDDRAAGRPAPEGVVVDGTGGWLVPVVRGWASTDDDEAFGYLVAANRIGEQGGWLTERLLAGLEPLAAKGPDMLTGVGYTPDDLSGLLALLQSEAPPVAAGAGPDEDEEEAGEPPPDPVSRRGDLWLLGPHHRVLCGDCRDPADVDRLLAGAAVNLAFTSPPYAAQRVYDESSGFLPVPPEEYVEWFAPVAANVAAHLAGDGSWFVNIKEHAEDGQRLLYVKDLTLAHVRDWSWRFVDEFCWTRNSVPGGWNNRFKNAWEPVFHMARAAAIKFRPAQVAVETEAAFSYSPDNPKSKTGFFSNRGRPDIASPGKAYPSNVIRLGAETRLTETHSAPFPIGLPEWFVRAYTDPGDTVFDPFMGSGSTLIAAHRQGRIGYGLEISPRYTDVILARFQRLTGIVPILESSGEPHDFCAEPAAAEPAG